MIDLIFEIKELSYSYMLHPLLCMLCLVRQFNSGNIFCEDRFYTPYVGGVIIVEVKILFLYLIFSTLIPFHLAGIRPPRNLPFLKNYNFIHYL